MQKNLVAGTDVATAASAFPAAGIGGTGTVAVKDKKRTSC
jgi:hypothetical protein